MKLLLAPIVVFLGMATLGCRAWAEEAPTEPDRSAELERALLEGAEAALAGEKRTAISRLERAALLAPGVVEVQEALGTAALLLGDRIRARRVLTRTKGMSLYLAMAQSEGPGGFARARTILAKEVEEIDSKAEPGALFLAALAFADAGQNDRAQTILSRAVRLAPSALDEAFSPDPAVAMSRSILEALQAQDRGSGADEITAVDRATIRLATSLFSAHRRGEAVRLAERGLEKDSTRTAALRILVLVENSIQARAALERVERVLAEQPSAEDAQVARVILLLRAKELERARRALEALPPIDAADLRSELHRARAEILLASKGSASDALIAAEAAARAAPKSNPAVAVLIRALLRAGKLARAKAFADALLKRKPRDVDPYLLLAEAYRAQRNKPREKDYRLRSKAFAAEARKLEKAVGAREAVLRAVRDAEGGLGPAGLEALLEEHPQLSLPVSLALARSGSPGVQAAARDRILSSCTPFVRKLLRAREGWDTVELSLSPYGHVEKVQAPLSGPDPRRCTRSRPKRKMYRKRSR